MCGISGLISLSKQKVSHLIKPMTDIISHRGPDGEGFISFGDNGEVALGHRRLAIVDLSSSGKQPMSCKQDRYHIVYNGEVYNFESLKMELETLGHKFVSQTDTEVILKSYEEWGLECLNKFNGMFAFIIFDSIENKVFIARDRFGVKPLYYWKSPQNFIAFASEIKQFTVLPGWEAKLNHSQAFDFLVHNLSDHNSQTMFNDVYQIRGGEYIETTIDELDFKVNTWYSLKPKKISVPFKESVKQFKELFYNSVGLRLKADVPVGTALSGGLDSSSIVCTVNEILEKNSNLQNTFSACSKVEEINEKIYVNKIVNHTNVNAHYVYPDVNDLWKDLDKIVWHQDEPFSGTSVYAEWCVYRLMSKTPVKVSLDGHGADEILYGYHTYYQFLLKQLLLNFRFIQLSKELIGLKSIRQPMVKILVATCLQILPVGFKNLLKQIIRGNSPKETSWLKLNIEPKDSYSKIIPYHSSISEISYKQTLFTSIPVQLHWADRDSMAFSIESRVPFLDYRLVEFSLGCPDNYKISNGWTKNILREAMKGILPEEIRHRKDKIGFATPESNWMKDNQTVFKNAIIDAVKNSQGILSDETIKIANDIISGRMSYDSWVWRIICFGKWMEVFKVKP